MRASRAIVPLVLAVAALVVACDNSSIGPTPPPPAGLPQLTCPANISVTGITAATPVTYPAPAQTGGVAPVNVTCAPATGASFAAGITAVTCNAKDAVGQAASCAFNVTVTPVRLGAVRFLAFGDSLTAGENGIIDGAPLGAKFDNGSAACFPSPSTSASTQGGARPLWVDLDHSYPTDLGNALTAQFPSQSIVVYNEGSPGESAAQGVTRFVCTLNLDQPDAVLLLEGINDLFGLADDPDAQTKEIPYVVQYLSSDISAAYAHGIRNVFVSSLLPDLNTCQNFNPCRGANVPISTIAQANVAIAAGVRSLGAVFVDSYAAFLKQDPNLTTLIGSDGLHATPAGYTVLAQTFQKAILAAIPQTTSARGPVLNTAARRR